MRKTTIVKSALAALFSLTLIWTAATSALAQNDRPLIDGNSIDEILTVARQFGSAAISRQQNGDPLIAGSINNIPYMLRFLNCAERPACEDMNFRVGFQVKPLAETINAWNTRKRFSRAYLDVEGDAILEMDTILDGGVSAANLNATFDYWRLSLNQFTKHIGFR